jgi:hypothetical protein
MTEECAYKKPKSTRMPVKNEPEKMTPPLFLQSREETTKKKNKRRRMKKLSPHTCIACFK